MKDLRVTREAADQHIGPAVALLSAATYYGEGRTVDGEASRQIAELFAGHEVPYEVVERVAARLIADLRLSLHALLAASNAAHVTPDRLLPLLAALVAPADRDG